MKNFKKIIAVLIVAVLAVSVLSLGIFAAADDAADTADTATADTADTATVDDGSTKSKPLPRRRASALLLLRALSVCALRYQSRQTALPASPRQPKTFAAALCSVWSLSKQSSFTPLSLPYLSFSFSDKSDKRVRYLK